MHLRNWPNIRQYAAMDFYDAAEKNIMEAIEAVTELMVGSFSDISLLEDVLSMMNSLYHEVIIPAGKSKHDAVSTFTTADDDKETQNRISWTQKAHTLLRMLSNLMTFNSTMTAAGTAGDSKTAGTAVENMDDNDDVLHACSTEDDAGDRADFHMRAAAHSRASGCANLRAGRHGQGGHRCL